MEACYKAAMEYFAETSAANPEFKKIYDDYKKFMDDQNFWYQVGENPYASFMASHRN
jgi:TRAP-type mannitol/chloroaromatic compound transport system substrate-binding protein